MTESELLDSLSPEESRDVAIFVRYLRDVRAKGFRPVIGASKGIKTKLIRGGNDSISVLVDELLTSDMFAATIEPDLELKAKLRGLKAREQMLKYQGLSWTSDVVAQYLKITPQMVSKKRRGKKLLGLSFGNKEYIYPAWQFDRNGTLPGLDRVLLVLDEGLVPDWDKLRFLVTRDPRLAEKSPVELLQSNQLEAVIVMAKVYGVQLG